MEPRVPGRLNLCAGAPSDSAARHKPTAAWSQLRPPHTQRVSDTGQWQIPWEGNRPLRYQSLTIILG